jgi:cytochrome c556
MTRRLCALAMTALTTLVMLGLGLAAAGTKAEGPTTKEVMKKLNGKGASESSKLKKALSSTKPDWDAIQASAKEFSELGSAIVDNNPPKGQKESWTKLAGAYGTESKALAAAADKKDLAGTKSAFGKLSSGCMACHKSHR